jgi:hypothetical protein
MQRTAIWASIGWAVGFFSLAALGFWVGFWHGGPSARLLPGLEAAFTYDFYCAVYFGWPLGTVGAMFGAATGCGNWLVRPRKRSKGAD